MEYSLAKRIMFTHSSTIFPKHLNEVGLLEIVGDHETKKL
jgi:hypothetical protein